MSWETTNDDKYTSPGVPKRDVKWYLLEDVDSRAKWFTVGILVISLAMLIAGSVMLGIGLSQNNNSPTPVTSPVSGYTMFLTVQTRSLPYSSIVSDYSGSVQNLTDQMQQAIAPSSIGLNLDAEVQVPITIVGISNAGQWADVIYALSYSDNNKPSLDDVQNRVNSSDSFVLVSATDKTASSLTQLSCATVTDPTVTTTTSTSARTTSKATIPSGVTTTTTPAPAPSVSTVTELPVTAGSTFTPPVPPVTKPARTTTTAFVKTPYSKDVIILLDDSTAMKTADNFNLVKSWIVNNLLPLWLVDREDVQVAFATFADNEFNTLLDFDEADENEVSSVISAQQFSGKFNSSITYGIRAAGDIHGLRPVNQTVLFISASEDLTDIESATQYAYLINTLPKQLITITVNSANGGKQLGLLSTNQNHYFGVPDFNLTSDIAQQLTQYMFGTLTPTTQAPTTTAVPDNSCKSDITILMDNNNDVGSAEEFQNQLRVISKLIKTWPISPELVEGEAVVFATTEGGQIAENPFAYQSASAFANEVMSFDDFFFVTSPPNLSKSLQFITHNLFTRRKEREQATIVFTYSSDNSDVQNAVQYADHIGGNLIVVAVGNADPTVLSQLSGNVVYTENLTTDIISQVNNLICSPTTRAPIQTTTTVAVPTNGQTSSPVTTAYISTAAPITTTVTTLSTTTTSFVDPCPDCNPKTSNVLILLEAFGTALQNQKTLVGGSLSTDWNNFERFAVLGYDIVNKYLDPINFGDLLSKDEFNDIVNSFTNFPDQPTLSSAFNLALTRAQPLKTYNKMHSVIFTSGASAAEITASLANSQTLRAKGKVIIVGLSLTDTTGLETLCDVLLKWDDLSNYTNISAQINQALNN